ncbi:MAG TPA: FapA family protein [Patescibacteria group bacterium]|nr:FapA family protein [Patescibacteria group bacterium]
MGENFVILEGKNLDGIIEEGIKKLGTTKNDINVEVLESKKSLFSSYFKVKISMKASANVDKIEKSVTEILKNNLPTDAIEPVKALEFIYKEDGVYIKLHKLVPFEDVKTKIEIKRINNVDLEALNNAIQSDEIKEEIKIAGVQEEIKIDSKCDIRLSADNIEAYLFVTSPLGGKDITAEAIYAALKENKITFGIKDDEIKNIAMNKLYEREIMIAEGIRPIEGDSAKLEFHFDTNSETKLLENEEGKIDYRELSLIKNVKADQTLVTMIPATEGVPGRNVLGEDIKAKEGRKLLMPKGKNVVISEDGLHLISSIDGEVKIIDDKVHVFALYMVPANVDNSTGNIRFIGKVIVKGNVITGFSIEAEGDVEVFGVVEGAKIVSKGNIILHRGIQGMNKGELYCDGDLVAKFIENSVIDVKGNIHSDAIMHSHIVCGKKLEAAGRKGLIVGGNFKVSDEIKAKVIGSPMATITELEVGANPEMRKKYEVLKQEHKNIMDNLEKVTQAADLLTKISQRTELSPDKKELLSKSIQAKLQLTEKLEVNNIDIKEMETYLEELSKGKIKASDIIYPGTRVTIGSSMMYVKDPLHYLTLYRSNAEVRIGPYEN